MMQHMNNWFERVPSPKPMEQVSADGIQDAELEIMQCDFTITRQAFLKHMAKARQKAMIEWVAKGNTQEGL